MRQRTGSVVITAMLIAASILLVTTASYNRSAVELLSARSYADRAMALAAAEAGLDAMLWEEFQTGGALLTHQGDGVTPTPSAPATALPGASIDSGTGEYRIALTGASASVRAFLEPGGSGAIRILSTGAAGTLTRRLGLYLQRSGSPLFRYAAFSTLNTLQVYGAGVIDSYDSRDGPYNPAAPGGLGHIGINAPCPSCNSSGKIDLRNQSNSWSTPSGDALVRGTAFYGPGGNASSHVKCDGTCQTSPPGDAITGGSQMLPDYEQFAPIVLPPECNGAASLVVNSASVLSGGTHCFLNLKLYDSLTFTAKAKVYITGKFEAFGAATVAAAGQRPADLQFLVEGSGGSQLHDATTFYGTIYSPASKTILGNDCSSPCDSPSAPSQARLFGAVVGSNIRLGSQDSAVNTAAIHFDEALLDPASGAPVDDNASGPLTSLCWQQLDPAP